MLAWARVAPTPRNAHGFSALGFAVIAAREAVYALGAALFPALDGFAAPARVSDAPAVAVVASDARLVAVFSLFEARILARPFTRFALAFYRTPEQNSPKTGWHRGAFCFSIYFFERLKAKAECSLRFAAFERRRQTRLLRGSAVIL